MASVTRSARRAEGVHSQRNGVPKRGLDAAERDLRAKRARIAVELLPPQPRAFGPRADAGLDADPGLTKHQAKVINGIRHELHRLQPPPADAARDHSRKLRSQEATRFKSDLAAYFPDYDEVIGNDPKEQHLLNLDTPIVVVDSAGPRRDEPPPDPSRPVVDFPVRPYGDALFADVLDSQRIDFRFLETQHRSNAQDTLPDSLFEPTHRRASRLERSIRNSERGRAQHERDQIIRLLDGLQGHDWLRVMGVSGITETRKKAFEPARAHFIKGCQAILEKFRNWSLEEKRQKQEKERALAEQAKADGHDGHDDGSGEEDEHDDDDHADADADADGPRQDSDLVSTSPAKQLRQEAMARSRMAAAGSRRAREFTSFFRKRYERDGALNRARRTGRKVLAWGLPVPDMAEADFELPEEYRGDDRLKSRARKKRRDKRGRRP